jgi:hypothetical protein
MKVVFGDPVERFKARNDQKVYCNRLLFRSSPDYLGGPKIKIVGEEEFYSH